MKLPDIDSNRFVDFDTKMHDGNYRVKHKSFKKMFEEIRTIKDNSKKSDTRHISERKADFTQLTIWLIYAILLLTFQFNF